MKGNFGERLKELRKAAGITQSELAEKLNIHLQTVSKWERNLSEPDISQLGELAEALGVSLEKLCEYVGVTREKLAACGDGYNDIPMIEYAGLGIAMANAKDPVREAADVITLSNDEDGIAAALEKYFGL